MKIRKLTKDDVKFTIVVEPEDIPIRGNYMVSGDDAADKEAEDEVIKDFNNGNVWAWCTIRVKAHWGSFSGSDLLGGCSYKDEQDFKDDIYYEDMKKGALEDLNEQIQKTFDEILTLVEK